MEKIAIASDHAGRELKEDLKEYLKGIGVDAVDMGVNNDKSVDYPDYGSPVAEKVSAGEISRGILLCGTGIGMSILANKYRRVRAALVNDVYTARMAKEHNDANIL
ncbi:MAG: RpiB/LacA/LacB family sugar-phosphate isomerase, partial [Deltaproteobacteria bacterium]